MLELLAKVIVYLAPMYFANSSAMILGGKTPVDFGAKLPDGKPVFGRGKTFRGLAAGISVGMLVTLLINRMLLDGTAPPLPQYVLLGFLLSVGALLGDMAGSFIKRRLGIEQGKPVLFLDQLGFVAGGIIFGLPAYVPSLLEIAVMAGLTLLVHRAANYIAYKISLKKVPW